MKIRKKNRAVLALMVIVSLVGVIGFVGGKINSNSDTLAAGGECVDADNLSVACGETAREKYWIALGKYFGNDDSGDIHRAGIMGNMWEEGQFSPTSWECGNVIYSDGSGRFLPSVSWDTLCNHAFNSQGDNNVKGVGSVGITWDLSVYLHWLNDNAPDLLEYLRNPEQYTYNYCRCDGDYCGYTGSDLKPGDQALSVIGEEAFNKFVAYEVTYMMEHFEAEMSAVAQYKNKTFASPSDAAVWWFNNYEKGVGMTNARLQEAEKAYSDFKDKDFTSGNNTPSVGGSEEYVKYEFQDWIYYDPVSGSADCNGDKYWTVWNQNTTCYRFFMVDHDDAIAKPTVRLVLDHDVGRGTFASIDGTLANTKSAWRNYTGEVTLMSESDLAGAMKLGNTRPTPGNSVDANGFKLYRYIANTMYYENGQLVNDAGWWTADLYSDDNSYAYTMTEYGNNRLVEVTAKRGIRPMITLEKSKITGSSKEITDITDLTKNAPSYRYSYAGNYSGHNYKQLQGFTLTNENLVFYSSNGSNPNYGLVLGRTGNNFSTVVSGTPLYGATGHGNDMTFDSKRNKVLLVGPNDYNDIWVYDGSTLAHDPSNDVIRSVSGSAIGYDNVNDRYILNVGRRAFITDTDFNYLYSLDIPHDETGQGFEYHNGYLYQTSSAFEDCGSNSYQLYCNSLDNDSSVINVYNMKFDTDGTPSKGFGRRVERLVIDGDANMAELESIAFHDDEAYLGFATQSIVSDPLSDTVYRFYHFDYDNIALQPDAKVSYEDSVGSTTVIISSEDQQFKQTSGWLLSNDGYSMTKMVNAASISEGVNVCDNYGNCKTVNVSHTNSKYGVYNYALTLSANGGINAPAAVKCATTADNGSCSVTVPTATPTYEGKYFLGYADAANAATTKYQPGDTITLSANKTIYAVWAGGEVEWQAGGSHIIGSGKDLVIRIDYPIEHFATLKIDNAEVDNSANDKYKVESGSTIVTIYGTHLDTLAVGEHTLQAVYDNDVVKEANFTILGSDDDPTGLLDEGDEDDIPVPNTSAVTPDTGANTKIDDNNTVAMIYVLPIVLTGFMVVGFVRYRNKGHRKFDF